MYTTSDVEQSTRTAPSAETRTRRFAHRTPTTIRLSLFPLLADRTFDSGDKFIQWSIPKSSSALVRLRVSTYVKFAGDSDMRRYGAHSSERTARRRSNVLGYKRLSTCREPDCQGCILTGRKRLCHSARPAFRRCSLYALPADGRRTTVPLAFVL